MKRRALHPIVYFSVIFLVLAGIQSYFLYNTVLLKKGDIKQRAIKLLKNIDNDSDFMEKFHWDERLYKWYRQPQKKLSKEGLEFEVRKLNDSLLPSLKLFVERQYRTSGLRLAFKKELIRVKDAATLKKIVAEPLIIFETDPKPINNFLLSESNWESTYSSTVKDDDFQSFSPRDIKTTVTSTQQHSYIIEQAIYYDVLNMNYILFKELWGLFLVAVLLMVMMLWLYFLSYKKYQEQRLQVILLHDTIDNISHEFKTPLATLKIASKQLQRIYSEETIALVERQIHRLEHLLKPLDNEEEEIGTTTKEQLITFLKDYEMLYNHINWKVIVDVPTCINLNPSEVETILGNLIENSIKYGSRSIIVIVRKKEDRILIEVNDDGPGISKNEQHRIFDKYYRVATQNIHNVKGLGVGLYLVHKIVKKYNGTLEVFSDLNKGCKINIQI